MGRRAARIRTIAEILLPAVGVVLLALLPVWWNRQALRARTSEEMRLEAAFVRGVEGWLGRKEAAGAVKTALFGDSVAFCERGVSVGSALSQRLASVGVSLDLGQIRHGAFRPIVYYYFLEDVLTSGARLAIVEVNSRLLSDAVVYARSMRYGHLSKRLSLARAWRVREMLHRDELSLLDPLLTRVYEWVDLEHTLAGIEDLGRSQLEALGHVTNAAFGLTAAKPVFVGEAQRRAGLESLQAEYGANFAAHPGAIALRELLSELRAAGIATLFYVSPIRLQRLESARIPARDDLSQRIEALRLAIGASPDEWADLHAIANEQDFRDHDGHMVVSGCELVARALEDKVAARVHALQ